ncbi:tetratricopeptide repeat protein [bacterium]|nr:tetratricopeptide repeat protein [candidate division CSSED10-310 bacterium]
MKVSLLQTPAWTIDTPPLGPALIAAAAREAGHEVGVFDLNVELFRRLEKDHSGYWEQGESVFWTDPLRVAALWEEQRCYLRDVIDRVLSVVPKICGFSVNRASLESSLLVARELKRQVADLLIVFGGPATHRDLGPELLERNRYIDYLVFGEAERSFPALLTALAENRRVEIPGIAYMEDEEVKFTGRAAPIEDLDTIPVPQFDGFPLDLYRIRSLPVIMGRGCRGRCAFCSDRTLWGSYRTRSAGRIVEDMRLLAARHHIDRFEINDSAVNASHGEFEAFLDALSNVDVALRWGGFIKAAPYIDGRLIRRMKKNGCESITIGLESGSQKVVDAMRKGCSVRHVQSVIRGAHEAGIKVFVNFMVGFPTETWRDFFASIWFLMRNRKWIDKVVSISQCSVLPNTELSDHPERFGILQETGGGVGASRYWTSQSGRNRYPLRLTRLGLFSQVVDLLGLIPDYVEQPPEDRMLDRARYYVETGRHGIAFRILHRLIKRRPGLHEAWVLLARDHLAAGRPGAAVELLQRSLVHGGENIKLRWLGEALAAAGRQDEAAAVFGNARVDDEPGLAARRKAESLFFAGRWLEAAEAARGALTSLPHDAALRRFLANSLWRAGRSARTAGRFQDAVNCLTEAEKYQPDDAGIVKELGESYLDQGALGKATRYLARALRLKPDEGWTWLSMGEALHALGRTKAGARCIDRCLLLAGDGGRSPAITGAAGERFLADSLWRAGRAARSAGAFPAAVKVLRKAAALAPDHAGIIKELGESHLDDGDLEGAAQYLARSLRLDPDEPWTWLSMGEVVHARGRTKAAIRCGQRCLKLMPDNERARRRLADWDSVSGY